MYGVGSQFAARCGALLQEPGLREVLSSSGSKSIKLYISQKLRAVPFVHRPRSVSVDKGQTRTIRDAKLFADSNVAQSTIGDKVPVEVALPADVLVSGGVVEHGSQPKDHRLCGDGLAIYVHSWPIAVFYINLRPGDSHMSA